MKKPEPTDEVTKTEFWTLYQICKYIVAHGDEREFDPSRGFGYRTWDEEICGSRITLRISPQVEPPSVQLSGPVIHMLTADKWHWHWNGKSTLVPNLGDLRFKTRADFDRELIVLKMATANG